MEVARVVARGCGTCKDRKILCDRDVPTCRQCTRSKRTCKGYGLQLSWPRPGDGRRAMVVRQQHSKKATEGYSYTAGKRLIHAHSRDVELHYYLTTSLPTRPTMHIPLPYSPSPVDVGDLDLLQYFQCAASQSLAIFGHDPTHLGKILMRIALTEHNTPSATAVRKSILALSSLHRYGVQEHAFKLKISSLRALAATRRTMTGLTAMETIQHVAAGMLLCSFEVHQSSCTSSQWTWYINGVKEVLHATCRRELLEDEEAFTLLNWVHYHDVMARFTMRHWSGEAANLPSNPSNVWPEGITQVLPSKISMSFDSCVDYTALSNLNTIQLLSKVCDAASAIPRLATMSAHERADFKGFLRLLDWRIQNTPIARHSEDATEMTAVVELHRLAMLVYLSRASGDLLGQGTKGQQHLDKAFAIFSRLRACERQFPVFILGSEARTDHERAIVLDLMSRTEKKNSSRSLTHAKILVQAMWAQNDLTDGEIDYWAKLTAIISCCSIVPSLV